MSRLRWGSFRAKMNFVSIFFMAILSFHLPYKLSWKRSLYDKMDLSTMSLRSIELNKEQEAATVAPLGNIRVIAGPGSGKTRVLVSRILHLINNENVKPSEILAVTFTKRAALELYSRVISNKNIQDTTAIKMLTTSTLHSFCSKLLRTYSKYDNLRHDYSIYDENDCKKIVKNVLNELNMDLSVFSAPVIIDQISLYKRSGDLSSVFRTSNDHSIAFLEIFKLYQAHLRANNAKDFDDLVLDTLRMLQDESSVARQHIKKKYRHLLIDEFQDIDNKQFQLLVELAKDENDDHENPSIKRSIYVVGDPYQTIYSWRGANPLNMELFSERYPQCKTFILKNNYRSNHRIVSAARHLMQNTTTIASLLKNKEGSYCITADSESVGASVDSKVPNDAVSIVNTWHDKSQAEYVAHMIDYYITNDLVDGNEIAVMYRTHSQSIPLQTALLSRQIKYVIIGDISLMNRKEIKDALAYLRLLTNTNDNNALRRIINYPPRGIGESLQSKLFPTDGADDSKGLLSLLVYLGNNEINKNSTDLIDNDDKADDDLPTLVLQDLSSRQLKSLKKASETFYELDKLLHQYEGTMEELVVQIFQKSGLTDYIREKNNRDYKVAPRLNHLDQLIYLARLYDIENSNSDADDFLSDRISAKDRLRDCLDTFLLSSTDESNGDTHSPTHSITHSLNDDDDDQMGNKKTAKIKLMTLHASKGLEFNCVFITGLEQNVLPLRGRNSSDKEKDNFTDNNNDYSNGIEEDEDEHAFDEDEERRLLYVGMTRARHLLTLTYRSRFLHTKGRTSPAYPSIFLKQLPKNLTFLKY